MTLRGDVLSAATEVVGVNLGGSGIFEMPDTFGI